MFWLPYGPRFVFDPQRSPYRRISATNQRGVSAMAWRLAADPLEPERLYVVERPFSGGSALWRTDDAGASWHCLSDGLFSGATPFDLGELAVSPSAPGHVLVATRDIDRVLRSLDHGASWSATRVPGEARALLIDARTAADPANTHVYAGTAQGLFVSTDGGASFSDVPVLNGPVRSLAAGFAADGSAHFFAGLDAGGGVWHATRPLFTVSAAPIGVPLPPDWTHLGALDIGLPNEHFHRVFVAVCPARPTRAYAWLTTDRSDSDPLRDGHRSRFLFTTDAPREAWHQVADFFTLPGERPNPLYGDYCSGFHVTPNSPGTADGSGLFTRDILFWCGQGLARSIDGGRTWVHDQNGLHVDQHSVVFARSPSGPVPVTWEGSDGGIARSTGIADPAFTILPGPEHFNEGAAPHRTGLWENRNHGKQSVALYQHATHSRLMTLDYLACQDTWVHGGGGPGGWRNFGDGDSWGMFAVAPADDGVRVWTTSGIFHGWPGGSRVDIKRDEGIYDNLPGFWGHSESNASRVFGECAAALLDGTCLIGGEIGEDLTFIHGESTHLNDPGQFTVRVQDPSAMAAIVPGARLIVDAIHNKAELVTVISTSGDSFTADYISGGGHVPGSAILKHVRAILLGEPGGICRRVSQDFGSAAFGNQFVAALAVSPDESAMLAITKGGSEGSRLWRKPPGTLGAGTEWTRAGQDQPAGEIASMALSAGGVAFVLLREAASGTAGPTPLFRIAGDAWKPLAASGLPEGGDFRSLAAHPVNPGLLYAAKLNRVFELLIAPDLASAQWRDVTEGLPGDQLYGLWAGCIEDQGIRVCVLRAACAVRGLWEANISKGMELAPDLDLYVRDNWLDSARLPRSPSDVPDPYRPSERMFHIECPDLKVDHLQDPGNGRRQFYQSGDPLAPAPISPHVFEMLLDLPPQVPELGPLVHAQVHNRSAQPADDVFVWVLACPAGIGLPPLNSSASQNDQFHFWGQFTPQGIQPDMPADSPWRPIGPPQRLRGVDAAHPRVASWHWIALYEGDTEYALLCLVYSPRSPIAPQVNDVDQLVRSSRQAGLRNVRVLPRYALAESPLAGAVMVDRRERIERPEEPPATWRDEIPVRFPPPRERLDLRIDASRLDPADRVYFRLPAGADEKRLSGAGRAKEGLLARLASLVLSILHAFVDLLRALVGLAPRMAPAPHRGARYRVEGKALLQGVEAGKTRGFGLQLEIRRAGPAAGGQVLLELLDKGERVAVSALYLPETRPPEKHEPPRRITKKDMDSRSWERLKLEHKRGRRLPPWITENRDRRWRQYGVER